MLERPDLWADAVVSEIGRVEVNRTFARVESEGKLTGIRLAMALDAWAALQLAIEWTPITANVLAIAGGPLPTIVKALDAVHLATALVVRESSVSDPVFCTHDRRLAAAATAVGFSVAGI